MKTVCRTALVALMLAAVGLARAGQPISLLVPVTYESGASVLNKTKDACSLEDKLATSIGGELQKRAGRPATTSATNGVVLRVTILSSGGIGGGGWTGSKSLAVRVDELQNGEAMRSHSFNRRGRGGLAGPFEGTCAILEDISAALARDIVKWSGTETDAAFESEPAAHSAGKAPEAAASAAD